MTTIREYDPRSMPAGAVAVIIGQRSCGKSVLLRDLIYKTKHNYDFALGMTATQNTAREWAKFMPKRLIYRNGYDLDKADMYVDKCKEIADQNKIKKTLLILDDVSGDKHMFRSSSLRRIAVDGRQNNCTVILAVQYAMDLSTVVRGNTDVVFALREATHSAKRKLWINFFGLFEKYQDFCKVFSVATEKYGCLVIDKRKPSATIEECIYYYRASPTVPEFKVGKPIFFRLSEAIDRLAEKHKKKNSKRIIL